MAIGYENYGNDPYEEDTQQALMAALRQNPALATPTQGQPQRAPVRRPAQGQMADPDAALPEPWLNQGGGYQPNAGVPEDSLRPVTSADVPLGQRSRLPLATAAARSTTAGATQRQQASDTALKAFNLMEKPVDVAAMEEAARARNEAASGDLGAGIIMSALGGKAFSPIGGHILTQAIKAKQPYDVPGGYGTMEGGKFIPNEFKMREQELSRLTALANFYETQAAHANTEEERERNNRLADETRRYAIEQQAETNRLNRASIEQRSADAKAARADRNTDLQNASNARLEDSMAKAYEAQVKDYRVEIDATRKIAAIVPALTVGTRVKPNSIEQQSLIVLFNKFLDPNSVVREGEFDRVVKAMGLEDRAKNLKNRILSGELLSQRLIDDIAKLSKVYEQAATTKVHFIGDAFYAKALERKLNPGNVVIDPYYTPKELRDVGKKPSAGTDDNPLKTSPPAAPQPLRTPPPPAPPQPERQPVGLPGGGQTIPVDY